MGNISTILFRFFKLKTNFYTNFIYNLLTSIITIPIGLDIADDLLFYTGCMMFDTGSYCRV